MSNYQNEMELAFLGRSSNLFHSDVSENEAELHEALNSSKCLVIGAAGTIGQAVTLELFKRSPKVLHLVDISENNMVEIVRSIRSTIGYSKSDFKTFTTLLISSLSMNCLPYGIIFFINFCLI